MIDKKRIFISIENNSNQSVAYNFFWSLVDPKGHKRFKRLSEKWLYIDNILHRANTNILAKSAWAVEYTDFTSAEG